MISTEERNPVQTNLVSKAFSIKVSGKAFGILIDGIYSDKIGAVVRELSTNAWDAHVERGNPEVPFEITLPSALSPVFRVRDFGVAMDHEMIMERYTTLFDSTKDDSNEVVGMLGIGSKSPFAYASTFGLRSILGGVVNSYTVHLGEDGVPRISHVQDHEPTNEPQGFEVTVAVQQNDFRRFVAAFNKVLLGFVGRTLPIVKGTTVPKVETVLTGDGWVMVNSDFPYDNAVSIRQGCVVYPTAGHHAGSTSTRILIDVPIGSCSVATSRESLAWDSSTMDFVAKLQSAAIRDITAKVLATVTAVTDPIERAKAASHWMNLTADVSSGLDDALRAQTRISLLGYGLKSTTKDGVARQHYRYGQENPSVVYKLEGEKELVREKLRIRQWARGKRDAMVATFLDQTAADNFPKLTGLVIEHVSTLPDPGPKPRTKKNETKAKFASGAYWIEVSRGRNQDGHHASPYSHWDDAIKRDPNYAHFFSASTLSFTPGEALRMKLPLERKWVNAIREQLRNDRALHVRLVASFAAEVIERNAINQYAAKGLYAMTPLNYEPPVFSRYFPWRDAGLDENGTKNRLQKEGTDLALAVLAMYPSLDRTHTLTESEIDVILKPAVTTTTTNERGQS